MTDRVVTLVDAASGARAKIVPQIGFNCISFEAPTPKGLLETLWTAPGFVEGAAKPSSSGIPLMFPFAGRLRGTSFSFEGRQFSLEAGDGRGNAIHGFVIGRPWRVTRQDADRLSGQFHASRDEPSLLAHWPADFRITVEYRVQAQSLVSEILIENPDSRPLPFGFGTHAYFRLPLGGASAEECRVTVPASLNWELDQMLPTGNTTRPPLVADLAGGMPASAMRLDHVLGGLTFENHRCATSIHDPHSGRTLTQTFDDQFPVCVVYNPPHREAVCIEPYTSVPDAFALRDKKVDPLLRVLPPGGSFRTRIEIRVS